jgi:hypothetical protein
MLNKRYRISLHISVINHAISLRQNEALTLEVGVFLYVVVANVRLELG